MPIQSGKHAEINKTYMKRGKLGDEYFSSGPLRDWGESFHLFPANNSQLLWKYNILKYSCFTAKPAGNFKATKFLIACFYFCPRGFLNLGGFTIFSSNEFYVLLASFKYFQENYISKGRRNFYFGYEH